MKTMKRIGCIALALLMLLALAAPALADDGYSITIKGDSVIEGNAYAAYQIFEGDYFENKLSNIRWGSNIIIDAEDKELELTLTVDDEGTTETLKMNADGWATYLADNADNSILVKSFAAEIEDLLKGEPAATATVGKGEDGKAVLGGLTDGYYLVKSTNVEKGSSYTEFMLQVVGKSYEVPVKADKEKVDKVIAEVDGDDNVNPKKEDAAIGDIITYEVTGTLPSNLDSYEDYYIQFVDTFSEGLTFQGEDKVTVTLVNGNSTADITQYFTAKYIGGKLYVTSNTDIKTIAGVLATSKIVVSYQVKLNENAKIWSESNPNVVDMKYTNDPNSSGQGNPWEPNTPDGDPKFPVGETPEDKAEIFTTEIEIDKVDGDGNPLAGAEFTLTANELNVVLVTREVFDVPENGEDAEYYKLKDGSYTKDAPDGTDENKALYEDPEGGPKYVKKVIKETVTTSGDNRTVSEFVGDDGVLRFTGLKAGSYTLTEKTTPDGYNTLDDDITFDIVFKDGAFEVDNVKNASFSKDTGKFVFTIENRAGTELPETGGIGTTIFYVGGAILMIGAAVILISKKRSTSN